MKNVLFAGIDVSKDTFDITIINKNNKIVMQNKFEMDSSESSINVTGRISKRGNAYLRKTIWQMAVGTIRCNQKFNDYFNKKMREGKKYKQAVIAVANKLIKTLYALLKNKTLFDPNYSR